MINIAIKEDYAEILGSFGDLQSAINLAVQRYTIEKITTKIGLFWILGLNCITMIQRAIRC